MTEDHQDADWECHRRAVEHVRQAVTPDEPMLVTVFDNGRDMWASANRMDPAALREYGIDVVLRAFANGMRAHPGLYSDVFAYGLSLPERAMTYLVDRDGRHSATASGDKPRDSARVRTKAIEGLAAMVKAGPGLAPEDSTVVNTTTAATPSGRPFPILDLTTPATPRPEQPAQTPGTAVGRHR